MMKNKFLLLSITGIIILSIVFSRLLFTADNSKIENKKNAGKIIELIKTGRYEQIPSLLQPGIANIEVSGQTVLQVAATTVNAKGIELVLRGADLDKSSSTIPLTPLMLAVQNGNVDGVKVLLDAGANPNITTKTTSALLIAIHTSNYVCMEHLLNHRANPLLSPANLEPLMLALLHKDEKAVKMLLEAGALPRDIYAASLLAVRFPSPDILHYLLTLDKRDLAPDQVADLLATCVKERVIDTFRYIVDSTACPVKAEYLGELYSVITLSQQTSYFDELLGRGYNINVLNLKGESPLTVAAAAGDPLMLTYLLKHAADPQLPTKSGTVLHLAVMLERVDLLEMLLAAGAPPDVLDATGRTPLMLAAAKNNEPIINLLLRYSANVTIADPANHDAMWYAQNSAASAKITEDLDNARKRGNFWDDLAESTKNNKKR